MSVVEALAAFEEARPPGVKHEKFRAELHRRFDSHRWGSGQLHLRKTYRCTVPLSVLDSGVFSEPMVVVPGTVCSNSALGGLAAA